MPTALAKAPAGLGHNNPPDEPADPFGAISATIEDLYAEAQNWADGTPIASQAQADEVGRLVDEIRKAEKAADDARIAEKRPLDDRIAAVQAKWAPLIADTKTLKGKTVLALSACKAALRPWLEAAEAENRRRAEEARREAEAKARAAAEAAQAARAGNDLHAAERAEEASSEALAAQRTASRAEGAKAHVIGGERAMGLRDHWVPKLIDGQAALRHYWLTNRAALEAVALDLARADVRAGKRQIPGFEVVNERRV